MVELDRDGASLLIRFPYREDLVAEVKNLPNRRWDPKQKTWRVPAADAERVYAMFARHLFDFAPEVMSLIAGTLGSAPGAAKPKTESAKAPTRGALPFGGSATDDDTTPATAAGEAPAALSISALNQRVREALRGQFAQAFWVVGEVLDYDKQTGKQHRFFSLIEKAPGEARPRARVEAALFERTAAQLQQRFAKSDTEFALRDGIEIRALVRVDLYPQSGRFQVVVEDIDPTFTLGKLALTREQILRELRDQGLADRNKALGLPVPARRIGVLTSPDSDGWNDFLRHLEEAQVGLELTLLPIKVQGAQLRASVLAGLAWFAEHADEFDALCILRGGGSRTDLAGFDDREVAFAVARHPLKVLVGIGHQRDQSVLDAIAHSEKTPTAVAAFLADCIVRARDAVRADGARLHDVVHRRLVAARRELDFAGSALARAATGTLSTARGFLATMARDLAREAQRRVASAGIALERCARDLHGGSLLQLERARVQLRASAERARRGAELRLERTAVRLQHLGERQRLLDPARVLGRGFALIRGADGRVLPAAARITADQPLVLQLRDGTVRTRAESVHLDQAP